MRACSVRITDVDVEAMLDHVPLAQSIEEAHRALSNQIAAQPVPSSLFVGELESETPAIIPMVAMDVAADMVVVKMLADAPGNRRMGLPAQRSSVAVFSATTAECLAVIDGRALTRIRTACTTAVASRALAGPGSQTLGLVGAGALAVEHVRSHAALLGITDVVVWSRSEGRVSDFRAEVDDIVSVTSALSAREVVESSSIVCTLTPSTTADIQGEWLKPQQHINAVGSPPRPQFAELRPSVFGAADVHVVDHRGIAIAESGNIRRARLASTVAIDELVELGDVLAGTHPGRSRPDQITLFNSVGIGLQDLAAAKVLLQRLSH